MKKSGSFLKDLSKMCQSVFANCFHVKRDINKVIKQKAQEALDGMDVVRKNDLASVRQLATKTKMELNDLKSSKTDDSSKKKQKKTVVKTTKKKDNKEKTTIKKKTNNPKTKNTAAKKQSE